MNEYITINENLPRIQYIADGTSSIYEFPFMIFHDSDIKVYFGSQLQDSSSYQISYDADNKNGSITFSEAPAESTVITIVRELTIERNTSFQEGGTLRASTLNYEFDYQTACQQQIADNLNRSMVLPPYVVNTDVKLVLPLPSAGKAIVWNSDGTNLENSTVAVNDLESTLNLYKTEAQAAATTATTKSGEAISAATTATNKATEAQTAAATVTALAGNILYKDLSNISDVGKTTIINYLMPDYTNYITVTTSGFTAEYDGLLIVQGYKGGGEANCSVVIDGLSLGFNKETSYNNSRRRVAIALPISKNSVITFTNISEMTYGYFFRYKGA